MKDMDRGGKVGEGRNEEREVGRKGISSAKLDTDERLNGSSDRANTHRQFFVF